MQIIDLLSIFSNIAMAAEEAGHAVAEPSVLGTLGVNWKLFLAQLVNFSLVLFVLWRWVFKPVSKKLTERSEKIATALKDAEDIEKEKLAFEEWKNKQIADAKNEAFQIITDAKKDAEAVKAEILKQAKIEQAKVVEMSKKEIHDEAEKSANKIKTEVATLVVSATEKILKEKLDPAKDKEILKKAITDSLNS